MKWLEYIRHVAEYRYAVATVDAQVVYQDDVSSFFGELWQVGINLFGTVVTG